MPLPVVDGKFVAMIDKWCAFRTKTVSERRMSRTKWCGIDGASMLLPDLAHPRIPPYAVVIHWAPEFVRQNQKSRKA
jgi:hypothetical protein